METGRKREKIAESFQLSMEKKVEQSLFFPHLRGGKKRKIAHRRV